MSLIFLVKTAINTKIIAIKILKTLKGKLKKYIIQNFGMLTDDVCYNIYK